MNLPRHIFGGTKHVSIVPQCLVAALIAVLLSIALIVISFVNIGTLGISKHIPALQTILQISLAIAIWVPILLAAGVTSSIPSLFRKFEFSEVQNGDLVWLLGVVIGLLAFVIIIQHVPCL